MRLGDLGPVIDGVENVRRANWFNTHLATQIWISKQPGANVVETADRIRAILPELRRWLPPGISLGVVADETGTIRASVDAIEVTLVISIALVVAVVFVFLRRLSATLIPSCVIPLALAGTFVAMLLARYTLDNLSLMALAVAVSFIMDDAVVVIENICRHLEGGAGRPQAAARGAAQIGPTLVSMSLGAGGGVRPDHLHDRADRSAAARVRPHAHVRDSRFGRVLAHLHPDDVQPIPARRSGRGRGAFPVLRGAWLPPAAAAL